MKGACWFCGLRHPATDLVLVLAGCHTTQCVSKRQTAAAGMHPRWGPCPDIVLLLLAGCVLHCQTAAVGTHDAQCPVHTLPTRSLSGWLPLVLGD